MRRILLYILLATCLLHSWQSLAQGQRQAVLTVGRDGSGTWKVRFEAGSHRLDKAGKGAVSLEVQGMAGMARHEGWPALPTMARIVALPQGCTLRLESVDMQGQASIAVGPGLRLHPWQGADVKDREATAAVPADRKVYGSDGWWRDGSPVEVEDLGSMGGRRIFRVSVHPAAYNPKEGTVSLATAIEAGLAVDGSPLDPPMAGPERYLVVSRPEFREGLQPFARWKRQTGFDVEEIYAGTADADSVKALIAARWDDGSGRTPAYVLIVGNGGRINPFIGITRPAGLGTHITDLYFAEHTGDYLPDAPLGRWPVADTAELRAVVEKTLRYEQGIGLDTQQLNRLLVVAGAEQRAPAPTTTNGQAHYVAREAKHAHPGLDTLGWENPASGTRRDDILREVGRGAALLNYTAHCTAAGWTSPAVTFSSLDTLPSRQPMLYVNNCCESNRFGSNCLGEQLLRKAEGGAIGVVGATNSTLWNEDYYWAVGPKYPFDVNPAYDSLHPGAFDRLTGRLGGVETQGDLLLAGNLAVSASGSPYDKFYWEIYCLLGDPSLMPYVGAPKEIRIEADSNMVAGATELAVAGTPGVRVALMQADSLLAAGLMPDSGRMVLRLRQSLGAGTALLTATGSGRWPRVDTLRVLPPLRGVGFRQLAMTDSTVAFALANTGREALRGIAVRLEQDSADIAQGAEVAASSAAIDSLLPGQEVPVAIGYSLLSVGPTPRLEGRLAAYDTARLGSMAIGHSLNIAYPTLSLAIATPDSVETNSVEAGSRYLLHAVAEGMYDSLRVEATPLPQGRPSVGRSGWTPFATGGDTRHIRINSELALGRWHSRHTGYLIVGGGGDGFEHGFGCYPWRQGGTRPWVADSSTSRNGRYSARSGAIDYRQTSDLELDVLVLQTGEVSFHAKTSSEEGCDRLLFSIDGTTCWQASGETDWTRFATTLTAGRHTLRWRYTKDESREGGSDCVWIDDVQMPFALWDSAYWCDAAGGVGIASAGETGGISVYPNPAQEAVYVVGKAAKVALADLYGRTLLEQPANGMSLTRIDLAGVGNGVYLLLVFDADGMKAHKLIISR